MEREKADLLVKERRRQRALIGTVAFGIALVIVSSRSERSMFPSQRPLPGVFATLSDQSSGIPGVSLRDGTASAFFASLRKPDVAAKPPGGHNIIPALSLEQIGPASRELMFVGPEPEDFVPGGPGISEIEIPDIPGPQPKTVAPPTQPDPHSPPGPGSGPNPDPDPDPDPNPDPDPGPGPGGTTPVPEPASWLLLITGFMAVGGMMRRYKARMRGRSPVTSA